MIAVDDKFAAMKDKTEEFLETKKEQMLRRGQELMEGLCRLRVSDKITLYVKPEKCTKEYAEEYMRKYKHRLYGTSEKDIVGE